MSITKATLRAATLAAILLPAGALAADLATDVAARLRDSGALQGYRVNVKAKSGTVWLEGRVADQKQLAAALGIVESCPGVERVVNRLAVEAAAPATPSGFGLPASMRALAAPARQPTADTAPTAAARDSVRLAQAVVPEGRQQPAVKSFPAGVKPMLPSLAAKPRPQPPRDMGGPRPAAYHRTAMRNGQFNGPMTLPGPGMGEEHIVPGTMQYGEGAMPGPAGAVGGPVGGYADGGMVAGGPAPMAGTGVGMPPIPMRGDGPHMPNYAWPSYAAYPNYAALQYPTQYSPTAWPYIGPFYPYPQVPLGWRRVSLEWDDGWWWLDFDERHVHSHHK